MLLKLVTLLGVILTLYGAFRRAGAWVGGTAPAAARVPNAADMARCPHCGAWHDPVAPCGCRTPYIP
jgi:hypothetical protein